MAVQQTRTVEAAVTLRVPRGAAGDMERGVRNVLEDVDGVAAVDVGELTGMRPSAADLYVDARVRFELEREPEDVRSFLRDGFGIEEVEVVIAER